MATAAAETVIPATPAGYRFTEWLDTFNRGDAIEITEYLQQHFPNAPPQMKDVPAFRSYVGYLEPKRIEEASDFSFDCLAKEQDSDKYWRIHWRVASETPWHILEYWVSPAERPADIAPMPRLSERNTVAAVRARLAEDVAHDRFSGVVLIAKGARFVFSEAVGLADRDRHQRNTTATQFNLASMDKMFTAVAVMQLVEQGKLRLDAPIGMYLRNYPNDALASKVTVHQLLTHTGGTGDIFGPEFNAHRLDLRQPSDYVALYGKRAAESGGRFSYSNYGYVLLGAAIESASGQGYYDYVREHVLLPARMHETESIAVDNLGRSCAVGYSLADGQWRSNKETLPRLYRGGPRESGSAGGPQSWKIHRSAAARELANRLVPPRRHRTHAAHRASVQPEQEPRLARAAIGMRGDHTQRPRG